MDDQLTGALKSLPRERAGPGFTAGVLHRLEEPRRPVHGGPARWPVLAATAAVLLLSVALGAREWWHFHQRQGATVRLQALEQERLALAAELAELRRQITEAEPVVYLGGSNDLDLVLDLERAKRAGVRPEDISRGLLKASRLVRPGRAWARPAYGTPAESVSAAGVRPRGPAPAPTGAGVYPARLDEPRTPTIY
jgi:hypothetical protein